MDPTSQTRRRERRRPIAAALTLALAAWVWVLWPRAATLRNFDPEATAALECRLWRSYYEHRRLALVADLYRLFRSQYGFSPWSSACLAASASRAAMAFQPTTNRLQATRALPHLLRYFTRIQQETGEPFDPRVAAERELEWWQQRREGMTWEEYAPAVARVTATIYGLSEADALPAARLRCEMMARRDGSRPGSLGDAGWKELEAGLLRAWRELNSHVARVQSGPRRR